MELYGIYSLCVASFSLHNFLRFICVATCINSLFLFLLLSNILSYEYTTFFLTYSSVVGHLGCFHLLTIVNSADVNIHV